MPISPLFSDPSIVQSEIISSLEDAVTNSIDQNDADNQSAGMMLQKPQSPIALALKMKLETDASKFTALVGEHNLSLRTVNALRLLDNIIKLTCVTSTFSVFAAAGFVVYKAITMDSDMNADEKERYNQDMATARHVTYGLVGAAFSSTYYLFRCQSLTQRFAPQIDSQNVHAHSVINSYVELLTALKKVLPNPIEASQLKDKMSTKFQALTANGTRTEPSGSTTLGDIFAHEMISLLPSAIRDNPAYTDARKLATVKKRINRSIDTMVNNQYRVQDFPNWVKSSEVLSYVWSFVEALSGDEESPATAGDELLQNLIIENMFKQLYSASGYCITGHVTRVLQGVSEALNFTLMDDNSDAVAIQSAEEFYTLHKNELNSLIRNIVSRPSTINHLNRLKQVADNATTDETDNRREYKRIATDFVCSKFKVALSEYMKTSHSELIEMNPSLYEDLVSMLTNKGEHFSIMIDNSMAEGPANSVGSFMTVGD